MKRNAIIRIVLYSLALVVLLGILGGSLGFRLLSLDGIHLDGARIVTEGSAEGVSAPLGDALPQVSEGETVSTVIDTADLREIDIDWAAGTITVISDELATQITVMEPKLANEKYQMRCFVKEKTLHIEYCLPSIGIHETDIAKDLMVIIPADWQCEELSIDSAAASINVQDLSLLEMEVNAASGVCNFTNCNINRLDVETASGDVTFDGVLNHLDVEAVSANCHLILSDHVPVNIEMESMSGDLILELPEDAGFALQMDALSGEFNTDFDVEVKNGKYRAYGKTQECMINLSALSGDVTVCKHVHTEDCIGKHSGTGHHH